MGNNEMFAPGAQDWMMVVDYPPLPPLWRRLWYMLRKRRRYTRVVVPIGTIMERWVLVKMGYATVIVPVDGGVLPREHFALLYQVIGDGWSTDEDVEQEKFRIPDMRGRVVVQVDPPDGPLE
jgi:hypothetical protein